MFIFHASRPRVTAVYCSGAAPLFFHVFFFFFAFHATGRNRPRLEPLRGYVLAAKFADSVGAVVYPLQGLAYLAREFSLSVFYAKSEVPVGLVRGPVGRVGEVFVVGSIHADYGFFGVLKQLLELRIEKNPEVVKL